MKQYKDILNRGIRLTEERYEHIETNHPEMTGQIKKISETLLNPERIVRSKTDPHLEMYYRNYDETPVTKKFLCVLVKILKYDGFIVTAYFTDTVKRGDVIWEKK